MRVSFADDRDNAEELTSAPTAPVEPEPDAPEPTDKRAAEPLLFLSRNRDPGPETG